MRLLPALRRELSLLPAPLGDDGTPRWFIFDPVSNKFHVLTRRAVKIISEWRAEPPETAIARLNQNHPELKVDKKTLKDITTFMFRQNLTESPPAGDVNNYSQCEAVSKAPLHERLMHTSLFHRIPLFRPHKFLSATAPYLRFLFTKQCWFIILAIGLIGLIFAARQWEQFLATFLYFFTLEGFVFYALSLTGIKFIHELGHAYTARHFGAHVPIMGIALVLMFPVLYTDTTDAWRITSRRKRALIDAAGMIAEFGIACIAIFLWSFLPDGPARSAAFFAATSSWLLSLMVNLNPCMRFDGYYLLSDLCGFQNMQSSGFALGKWKLRKALWGINQSQPLKTTPLKRTGLLVYAYCTWAYRLFLFTAIGLLLYHIIPKPFGIFISIAIMTLFIGAPIKREVRHWGKNYTTILSNRRGRFSLTCCALLLALFFLPWQSRVTAPALMQPILHTEIFSPRTAHIDHIHVEIGDNVQKGDLLMTLGQSRINIYAPHNGIVTELPHDLHAGRYIRKEDPLMRIVSPRAQKLVALPLDIDAARLSDTAPFTFISDDAAAQPIQGRLTHIAPSNEVIITDRLLTSMAGGKLAVNPSQNGELLAHRAIVKIQGQADEGAYLSRAQRGVVKIKAKPQSPAQSLWKSIIRVLIRETDF
jgi:putative peptide zinc metalloprotease protein